MSLTRVYTLVTPFSFLGVFHLSNFNPTDCATFATSTENPSKLHAVMFLGTIFFLPGQKHPKLIVDGHIYIINKKKAHKTLWMCTCYSKTGCKSRMQTTGRKVVMNRIPHNHESKLTQADLERMVAQTVYISRK